MSDDGKILAQLLKNMKSREDDPLRPLIDAYMLERKRAENRLREYPVDLKARPRPIGRLSPSSIAGCERQAAFKFVGMPGRNRIDPDAEVLFDDGDWRHHRWQATFYDMELVLGKKRFKVISIEGNAKHSPLYIAGSMDAVVRINGALWVIDFKGINSYGFKHVKLANAPKEEHVLQLLSYMRARKVRRGIIFYENKDTQETMSFIVNFDMKEWGYIKRWCERVIKQLDNEELPEAHPDCTKGHFLWTRCPFADWCFTDIPTERVRKRMYRNFPGVQELWEEGHRIIKEHEESSP